MHGDASPIGAGGTAVPGVVSAPDGRGFRGSISDRMWRDLPSESSGWCVASCWET